jgi:hypothetical protein
MTLSYQFCPKSMQETSVVHSICLNMECRSYDQMVLNPLVLLGDIILQVNFQISQNSWRNYLSIRHNDVHSIKPHVVILFPLSDSKLISWRSTMVGTPQPGM